jgi:hypothetical protein
LVENALVQVAPHFVVVQSANGATELTFHLVSKEKERLSG